MTVSCAPWPHNTSLPVPGRTAAPRFNVLETLDLLTVALVSARHDSQWYRCKSADVSSWLFLASANPLARATRGNTIAKWLAASCLSHVVKFLPALDVREAVTRNIRKLQGASSCRAPWSARSQSCLKWTKCRETGHGNAAIVPCKIRPVMRWRCWPITRIR